MQEDGGPRSKDHARNKKVGRKRIAQRRKDHGKGHCKKQGCTQLIHEYGLTVEGHGKLNEEYGDAKGDLVIDFRLYSNHVIN